MVARELVFWDCRASQTHIPTRNRYLVSSEGLKIHVSVWDHRGDSLLRARVQDAPSRAAFWLQEVPLPKFDITSHLPVFF